MLKFEVKLPEDFFEEGEKEKFEKFCSQIGEGEFDLAVNKIILAAFAEYKDMFLGRGMPSRADEIQQHRLNYLIKYFHKTKIPSEQTISTMFHITSSKSRSLIRSVLSRFRYDNEEILKATISNILEEKKDIGEGDEFQIEIQSRYILEELNRIISLIDSSLEVIKKVSGSSGMYTLKKSVCEKVENELGIG